MAIPRDWFALALSGPGLRSTFSGAAAGVPLMLCSCCAPPVFEGMYGRTRRLGASLALMLAAPGLNPTALALTFILFPVPVAIAHAADTRSDDQAFRFCCEVFRRKPPGLLRPFSLV
jgi:uncharacterized membrane protein YraQ (UPF0718 family)